jgi:3'-phosphoadenosine 5'-phosphosulfate sulfotransferase (PAPS reductase)/FAD synthetase
MDINGLFARHNFAVLEFSGGKDSLACLYIMRDYWHKIMVVWCNTGAAFPETIEQMAKVKAMVPYFLEVKSDQAKDIAENGIPVDVLPYTNTEYANASECKNDPKMRIFYDCCKNNIWIPMHEAVGSLGATLVIRGQKDADRKKAPVKSGDVYDGVEYFFPLEEMTDDDVFSYLSSVGADIPEHYSYINTSLDCWDCTAYMFENVGKVKYMKERHPEKAARLIGNLKMIRDYSEKPLRFINESIGV